VTVSRPYRNPVHPGYFADPFVLEVDGGYLAVGTGSRVAGRVFEVLRSSDLVRWKSVGGALEPLGPDLAAQLGDDYWAPEVTAADGRWWMYYSVGRGDVGHSLRVATADDPAGPYTDCGVDLTPHERFAIDPHPFVDADGTRYLFYARDVLEGPRVGTMLAVDVLDRMDRLSGRPTPVLAPSGDWQIFRRDRRMYGGVHDWHTLEGPFVRRRGSRYVLFYSGGNWEEPTYAVSWAEAEHPLGPWREPPGRPPLLRTVPGRVIGPGHNSLVVGPDGQDVVVYHAWDPARTARRMCIDPVAWTGDGPVMDGPTWQEVDLQRPVSTSVAERGLLEADKPR
jgi:arabinan endo-1,5-alpha-L-arabinosidase